jgi:hypothetical protein
MARVRVSSGPNAGDLVELAAGKVVFGRHQSCDIVIPHPTISRRHFSIECVQNKHLLVDEKSGNGTFVNGEAVSWVELKPGDRISAGPFAFVFESDSEVAQTPQISANAGVSVAGFAGDYPREYLLGIEHFNSGRYFEAHEIWEEIWLRSSDDAKVFFQMLIQAAVGLLHYERGNLRGASGMYRNVLDKLSKLPPVFMSLNVREFERQFVEVFAEAVESGWEGGPGGHPPSAIRLTSVDDSE